MTNPIQATQEDREVAAAIDALEWLFCDGRPNPELLFILARYRIASEHRGYMRAVEDAARVAEAHSASRRAAQDNAKARKQRQEARDHESMAIEGIHIATAIRNLKPDGEGER